MTDPLHAGETANQSVDRVESSEMTAETIESTLTTLEGAIDWTGCITGQLSKVQRYYRLTAELAARKPRRMPSCRYCGASHWHLPRHELVECQRCGASPRMVYRSIVQAFLTETVLDSEWCLHTVSNEAGTTTASEEQDIGASSSRSDHQCGWCHSSFTDAAVPLAVVTLDHSPRVCQNCVAKLDRPSLRQALAAEREPHFGRLLSEVSEL